MTDELEKYAALLEESGDYRVLRRFTGREYYAAEDGSDLLRGVFLDVETTGTDVSRDGLIELAIVPFRYSAEGRIYGVEPALSRLQDPGKPLPPFVKRLTGLRDEDVRGHEIDPREVEEFLEGVSLVVAHNAGFDRPFFEKAFPDLDPLPWACSVRDVPWQDLGVEGRKLEYLAYRSGIFFDGHRAEVDCQVGIHVLASDWLGDGSSALARLLEVAARTQARLWAVGSAFEHKDLLKRRGYRFDGPRKTWYLDLSAESVAAEQEWLATNIYAKELERKGKVKLRITYVTARERYRTRLEPAEDLWLEALTLF